MAWLIISIGLWGVVHSWLASLGVKRAVASGVGASAMRGYRLAYNVFSAVTLFPTVLIMRFTADHVLYAVAAPWRYWMLAGQALAAIGLLVAISQTDAMALLGFRQLMGAEESSQLVTSGFYRYMRHPMYFFGLLLLWLSPTMTVNTLVAWIALTLYLIVGAHFEERKLVRMFGAAYSEYRARTPMMIPLPTALFGGNGRTART